MANCSPASDKAEKMNKQQLEKLEAEVNAELYEMAKLTNPNVEPITDGVVDIDLYLASQPKILWILKEPFDDFENGTPCGGGWSMTKHVLAAGKFGNKPPFAPIAYIAYSVFNDFLPYQKIEYVTENPLVKAAVKRIAYINVNKMPALSTSGGTDFAGLYAHNRSRLLKQISTMQPDILIFGSTIGLFLDDLDLKWGDLNPVGSLKFCVKARQLFIDAYHPSQWSRVSPADYVNEIVSVIKTHSPALPPPQSSPIIHHS
jgi:hypothetical protein